MRKILLTFVMLNLIVSSIVSSDENTTETIVLAIDVSKSMRFRLDGVKAAVEEFIEKTDTDRGFHFVIVKFGTFADVVAERVVRTEADKDYLKSVIRDLKADQPDTNFDEALDKIELKIRRIGAGSASILLYSDGISEPTPGSGKPIMSLEGLASKKFPIGKFNVYLVNLNPKATPMPENMLSNLHRADGSYPTIINVRPEDLQMVTSQIRADIERKFDEVMKKLGEQPPIKEVKPAGPKPEPNLVLGFLRNNWKLLVFAFGLIILGAVGYGVWWAFIREDPKVRNMQNQWAVQPRQAKISVVGEANKECVVSTSTGSFLNIGSDYGCRLRMEGIDRIAATISFEDGEAFLERKGNSPVRMDNDEQIIRKRKLTPGDTFMVGNHTLRYELVPPNLHTSDDIRKLFK